MKHEFSWRIFENYSNIKFHKNPSSGSRFFPAMQRDRRTDMTNLIVAFRNFVNAPKNQKWAVGVVYGIWYMCCGILTWTLHNGDSLTDTLSDNANEYDKIQGYASICAGWRNLSGVARNSGLYKVTLKMGHFCPTKNDPTKCTGLFEMIVGVLPTCHTQYTWDMGYVVARMDQEILRVLFYDVRCAVVMHFSAWSAVY